MGASKTYANIEGVVLAGGQNSRFNGEVKANIIIDKKPLIGHTLDLLESIFSVVSISTNSSSEFSSFSSFRMIPDIYKRVGPLGGIHAAMSVTEADALFVVAGDMPNLSENIIRYIAEYYVNTSCEIVIPRISGYIEPLHAIYGKSVFERLSNFLSSSERFAIRDFIAQTEVEYLDLEDLSYAKEAFTNINTPEDLIRVRAGNRLD